MLGVSVDGHLRINAGTRSAPYRLTDVGCDWHRIEQLCTLAETDDPNDEQLETEKHRGDDVEQGEDDDEHAALHDSVLGVQLGD